MGPRDDYRITYRPASTTISIEVEHDDAAHTITAILDGGEVDVHAMSIPDDGAAHRVSVRVPGSRHVMV